MSITRKKVSDLLGYRQGRLEVIEYLGKGKWDKHRWKCKCDCGGEITLNTSSITGNTPTVSCGCLRIEKLLSVRFSGYKHGKSNHKLYNIYNSMLQRCSNPNSQRYKYYGQIGISVCDEWKHDFMNFYNWAIANGYANGLSIDRLDSGAGYNPQNCEWVTVSENSRRMNERRYRK
jgi:hypothetical protein